MILMSETKENLLTLTAIKADVGSIGGHTLPSAEMLELCRTLMGKAQLEQGLIVDWRVTHIGDDICLFMTHREGSDNPAINDLAWNTLFAAAGVAKKQGLYGAGQDLLEDAPSGNVRGAGPGIAEITIDLNAKERPAESFMVVTADKCGPGVYNWLFGELFMNPAKCAGLMLPVMLEGFTIDIIDMDYVDADRMIRLNTKTQMAEIAFLLRDENRFAIRAIWSNKYPDQQVFSASTDRLHNHGGVYLGKDDPVAIVRSRKIFPAPEELVSNFMQVPYVAGDARGSHHMPIMPVKIGTPVTGVYCLPIVAAVAYSVNADGMLTEGADLFGGVAWDRARAQAQLKAELMRNQGWFGAAMLHTTELEYSAFGDLLKTLEAQFVVQK